MAEMNEIKDPKEIKGDKEAYDPTKKREIIKNVLIIFLAALLVLTFFSNTIMNKSLAEITTERAASGKLTERIRESGIVESNQSYGVTVDGNKVIDTIMVKAGQTIKKDDVLLTVGTGESDELTAAEDALSALELAYQTAILTPPVDYSAENQAIKNAREDLTEAISKRDQAAANQGSLDMAKQSYDYNKKQVKAYTKLQSKYSSVITAIDTDSYLDAPAEYTSELIELKNAYEDAQAAYNTTQSIYESLITPDSPEAPTASEEDIEDAKAAAESKEAEMNTAKEAYDKRKSELRREFAAQLADAEANIDRYNELIADYEANSGSGASLDALNEDVSSKQRNLENLIISLEKTKKDNSAKDKIESLNLEVKKKEIEKAKEKVKKLKEKNETTEIKSKYSGIVSAVNCQPGDTTVPGSEIITIDIAEEGYTVKIKVDGEKTKKLKKGTAAEVVNNWSGGIDAVLTDIKNDTQPNSKSRILVFSVTGDVNSGSYIDLSIPCGSGSYDTIVPKSAVYEDKDGKFVLTVASKSSPLGNRYYAERVNVEVLASDEVSCAVSGSMNPNDYVIVAASKPVSPKDQVRMKDK